jgi:UDP-N-acetyl-D-glucosamine dehydrogenase
LGLKEKIADGSARLSVVGLGYVGLPLLVEYARAGFHVIGLDIDAEKVKRIGKGDSYVGDVPSKALEELIDGGKVAATTDFSTLKDVDTVNICVPTPLRKTRDPDISFIMAAVEEVAPRLHREMLVILESTTYPGTTEEVILPRLQETGLEVGKDFFLAFSPERVDPGNARYTTRNIPKVVGGITPACTEMAVTLFRKTLAEAVPVSSSAVAETVKLLENTFRSVNIALVNEIALMCHRMGIDVWEVIDAAATKPFGFMPFYPGPGLGGHCIPIDPFYLSWKAKLAGFEARFIELAGQVNGQMPEYVVTRIADALNGRSRSVRGSTVLVVGVAYKAGVSDTRESPAIDVMELLKERGAHILYHDPYVESLEGEIEDVERVELEPGRIRDVDLAVVITGHEGVDYEGLLSHVPLVLDTRNVYGGRKSDRLIRL